jgi:Lrp/AsnC family transcriptional regulator, regulator for asnA, asnC and gidA
LNIIQILTRDAQKPFSQIAKELNIGTDTVFRRYKRLRKQGAIRNPTIVLDSKMCGFEGLVDFLIKAKPGADTTKIQEQLAKLDTVTLTAKTLGDHDLYCSAFFRDFKNLTEIGEKIREIENIVTAEPVIYIAQNWTIPSSSWTSPAIFSPRKNIPEVFEKQL